MGLWSKIKKFVNGLVNTVIDSIILTPLRAILKAIGFYKFIDFLEKIVNFIKDILSFFLDMLGIFFDLLEFGVKFLQLIFEIAINIGYYITRPFELLVLLIKLALCLMTFWIAFIYHKFTLPNDLKVAEFFIYVAILVFIYTPVMTFVVLWYWITYKLLMEYGIMHNIDKNTGGVLSTFIYRYFTACENPPDAWYMTPSWHMGNENKKLIFSFNKCPTGFVANDAMGLFCEKNHKYELDVCPQANLYRVVNKLKPLGDLRNRDFNQLNTDYLKASKYNQKKILEEYKEQVKTNNGECNEAMKDKENLLKSICMKYDKASSNDMYKEQYNQLCYDLYCRNSKNEPFCHKLKYSDVDFANSATSNIEIIIQVLIASALITLGVSQALKN